MHATYSRRLAREVVDDTIIGVYPPGMIWYVVHENAGTWWHRQWWLTRRLQGIDQ